LYQRLSKNNNTGSYSDACIYVLGGDLSGSAGTARYSTTGIAPNRVFTMEWSNYKWEYSNSVPNISFQLKLFETTNAIKLVYDQIAVASTAGTAIVGFAPEPNGTYISQDNLGTAPSIIAQRIDIPNSAPPADGQTYTYTPGPLYCPNLMTLNSSGGNNASDGLEIYLGGSGALQIRKGGSGQIFNPNNLPDSTNKNPSFSINTISLAVGTTVFTNLLESTISGSKVPWTITYNSCQSTLDLQTGGTQKDTIRLQGISLGRTYSVRLIYTYIYPRDYFNIDYQVTIPPGNTAVVKLSHTLDTYLGGSDSGPAYISGTAPNLIMGTSKPGVFEAFRYRSGSAWTSYYSGYYLNIGPLVSNGGDLDNTLNMSIVDNGIAIQLNMGSTPGVYNTNSDLIISSSTVLLPVSLLSFDATKNNNKGATLSWATASEHNSAYFDAERSEDGKNYRSIGKVTANGNTNTEKSYKLDDTKPVAGMNYYRLKTVDVDGKSEYSPVRILNFGANANIIIYPNPAETEVTVAGVETGMHVNILGMDGRTIVSYPVTGNKLDVSLKSIQSGLYILQVRGKNGEVISSQKLMKK
jgi:hypothetical protein